ncbi:Homeobox protein 4 [Ceratocystis fimbriata CBS 114723]|uniref:Homeobox protein 4 n=1 Tax=Ceratocystis fimbriata CBS 114723 TaxID=1035309 RepID=A0A2C5XND8_9PEZI|nr:Homeobox protein 4 [Ceratocystis fimbriata CBS 114723]
MDEFLNWDGSVPPPDSDVPNIPSLSASSAELMEITAQDLQDDVSFALDLAFNAHEGPDSAGPQTCPSDNIVTSVPQPLDPGAGLFSADWLINAPTPCLECLDGGFLCKLIKEGQYKGFCTSCVALGSMCSFGNEFRTASGLETSSYNSLPIIDSQPSAAMVQNPTESFFTPLQASSQPTYDSPFIQPRPFSQLEQPQQDQKADAGSSAKTNTRFSRASVRVLRQWLSSHSRHPYPSDEEKDMLQRQTGLNKTQITNWLANARRRGKVQIAVRSTSPHPQTFSLDSPRRNTPGTENMNPLQRWANSPPEHEPASAIAIARAVTASSSASSTGASSYHNYTDDGSGLSLHGSSASSVGTSRSSGGSFASAMSHASRGSIGSFSSMTRGRRRRRRRAGGLVVEKKSLHNPLRTYQCTFCPETFKTKHDWQRHEKSLHLSLERWVCSPNGTAAINPANQTMSCVFCGEANPSEAHLETHNCSSCLDKTLPERTFYRKDHLNQHLRLVHNVRFVDWSMKDWKISAPTIQSRCGFCGIVMTTWAIRIEHLSEHFKSGASMSEWKGDWGFERHILDLVENSIPPYLIDTERNSPYPMAAEQAPPESPRDAYELIKDELVYYMANRFENNHDFPTDDQLRVEACRIIFASEVLSLQGISSMASWLRDVLMDDEVIYRQAKFGPLRTQAENRLAILKINGKDNLFEACPLEHALQDYVVTRQLIGMTPVDSELQEEACRIVGQVEEVATHPCEAIANFLLRLIKSSTKWLARFRQRAHLPRSEEMGDEWYRSTDPATIDSTIHSYSRLERELGDYLEHQRREGIEPTNLDLQRRARIIIYEFDDGWNQTAADSTEWLTAFRERHPANSSPNTVCQGPTSGSLDQAASNSTESPRVPVPSSPIVHSPDNASINRSSEVETQFSSPGPVGINSKQLRVRIGTFLNDSNCFRRLERELSRYVTMCMSNNNPNKHVPTDEELQHQARWVVYDDDDPWNQTAADNLEWLRRFKRCSGLLNDGGPGLSRGNEWNVSQGGSGFAPPFAYPKNGFTEHVSSQKVIDVNVHGKIFGTEGGVASKYLEDLEGRYPRPAVVFCSRELESGLIDFVSRTVASGAAFPTDVELKDQARRILSTQVTAADDEVLLEQFKKTVKERLASVNDENGQQHQQNEKQPQRLGQRPQEQQQVPEILVDQMMTERDFDDLLDGINFDLELP